MADARLLRRVLRNLLENAIRHGASAVAPVPAVGRGLGVQLTVDQVSRNGTDFAQLTVDDQGPGVPAVLRTKVFEPFYRLPGASERDGGVGLGLALVRSIVQQHGGTVACTERPGGGGRFVVCLPIQPPIS
jgi:signal transduction histidine kinase